MGDETQETIAARTLDIPGKSGMYGGDTFGGATEDTVTAYRLTGKGLARVTLVRNPRFVDFATDWEKAWSALIVDRKRGASPAQSPVVGPDGLVVGHYGRINGENVLVPERSRYSRLRDLLLDGIPVFIKVPVGGRDLPVTINNTPFVRPFTTEERFQLIMDVEGRSLGQTSYDVVGLESADEKFWALVGIGSLIVALGKAAGRKLIASLVTRAAARRVVRRVVGRMTVEEMERFLTGVMQKRPELGGLYAIRVKNLTGEPLRKEVLKVLSGWEKSYGRSVRFVEEGVVQNLTTQGNLMSLQGNQLLVERQLLGEAQSQNFFEEVVHELAADALGVRGQAIGAEELAFIGEAFSGVNNALFILEHSLMEMGGLKRILAFFRGP